MSKKKLLVGCLGSIILIPIFLIIGPFLIGGFVTYKIIKSQRFSPKVKAYVSIPVILISLLFGSIWTGAWVTALKSPSADTQVIPTQEKPQDVEVTQESSPSVQEPAPSQPFTQKENEEKDLFKVIRVIDGDTVELEGGIRVRYIGIDTPETVNPNTTVECFGQEASNKNKELVEGKNVRLEKDVSEADKYGRLLRYIYVDDIFVNDYLVRQGYANASSYPPDVKYQDKFRQAETEAREYNRGLWNACTTPTQEEQKPAPQPPTPAVVSPPTQDNSDSSYTCDCKKTCAQMSSCEEAQYQLNVCGCTARDADHDGIACDSQCQ